MLGAFPYGWLPQELRGRGPGLVYAVSAFQFAGLAPGYFGVLWNADFDQLSTALERTATVGKPLTLDLWVEDDGLYSSGSNAPVTDPEEIRMAKVVISKYRGPGPITVAKDHEKLTTIKGGKPGEPYAGKTSTTVTFTQPGDYMLHVTVNDLSGPGGGATGCCWTTSLIKVDVKGASTPTGR